MAWVSTKDIVQSQIDSFKGYANEAYNRTLDAITSISDTFSAKAPPDSVGISVPGDDGVVDVLPGYTYPAPVPALGSVDFVAPEAIGSPIDAGQIRSNLASTKRSLSSLKAPVFTGKAPTLKLPAAPNSALPDAPEDPAPLEVPDYPSTPNYDEPQIPTLRSVYLPTLSPPNLAIIDALLAQARADQPTVPVLREIPDFGALFDRYYSKLTNPQLQGFVGNCSALTRICPTLNLIFDGGLGLPASVAAGLRDRAFLVVDQQSFQADAEARRDWLARGFTLPNSVLGIRLDRIGQDARDQKAKLNRELWLEEAKIHIESLRFAVEQGIAYEKVLRDAWVAVIQAVQGMATAEIEMTIKGMELALELFKTKVEMWRTEFETIRDQLQAELSKVEVYKAELDAQRLISELNTQDVALYNALWQGVNSKITVYKTKIDAANSLLQAELAKLEWTAKAVQIYSAKVSAYTAEWQGYGSAVSAEKTRVDAFEVEAQAFSSLVNSYSTQVQALKTVGDFDVEELKLQLEAWQSGLEKYKADLTTEQARIDALLKKGGTEADIFKTKALVETGYTDFEMKKLDYSLNKYRVAAEIKIKETDLEQTKMLELSKIAVGALDGVARTGAQLSGSAMAAMNVHAGLTSSSSSDYSENHNYSYTA